MRRQNVLALALLTSLPALALTTYGVPEDYTSPSVSLAHLSGVVRISSDVSCSGALLDTQMHVITAAHCLDGGLDPSSVVVTFMTGFTVFGAAIHIEPTWTGVLLAGNDIAILTLIGLIDPGVATGYGLYTGTDEAGQIVEVTGYGIGGQGVQGAYPFGTLRTGQNRYDATGSAFPDIDDRVAVGDFDNGTEAQDAMALLGFADVDDGNLALQVMIGPGDSGGPSFLNGLIVGIHSFRGTLVGSFGEEPDIDGDLNSSFGEIFGDTRVSQHLDWIDAVSTPEPDTFLLSALGLAVLALRARKTG